MTQLVLHRGMRARIMAMPGVQVDIARRTGNVRSAAGPQAESTVMRGRTRPRGSVRLSLRTDADRTRLIAALDAGRR